METKQKPKEEKTMRSCEVCGKQTLGFNNFCMCNECFGRKDVQRALFRI